MASNVPIQDSVEIFVENHASTTWCSVSTHLVSNIQIPLHQSLISQRWCLFRVPRGFRFGIRNNHLIAARRAMTAIDGGDLLSVLETVAAAARGIDSGADGTAEDGTAEGGDEVADDRGETSSPLGGAQSFEYGEDAPAGDVEQLAGGEGTPGNNQAQNKQFKAVVKAMGLDQRQARQLHDEISGEGLGYHEITERAQDMFGASE